MASQQGQAEVAQLLCGARADIDKPCTDGATPLLMASQQGHAEVAQLLAEQELTLTSLIRIVQQLWLGHLGLDAQRWHSCFVEQVRQTIIDQRNTWPVMSSCQWLARGILARMYGFSCTHSERHPQSSMVTSCASLVRGGAKHTNAIVGSQCC